MSRSGAVMSIASPYRRVAVGASGGRRILPAVAQLLSFVMDYGMDLDTAMHQPRIDASEGPTSARIKRKWPRRPASSPICSLL